jgi:hypothetical protein
MKEIRIPPEIALVGIGLIIGRILFSNSKSYNFKRSKRKRVKNGTRKSSAQQLSKLSQL